MKQTRDFSPEKQIERLEKQIVKFGDPKKNPNDKHGPKQQMIRDLEVIINDR